MTALTLSLIALSEACGIAGQLFFKLAMGRDWSHAPGRGRLALAAGLAVMALGFFIWLGLLSKFDLSFLYPFEGLNRLLLLLGAAFFLREKITANLWLGVLLISAGVVLVAGS